MEHKDELIKYRIQRSEKTLNEAKLAIDNNALSLAENIIYYAIFYIVSALAINLKTQHIITIYPFNRLIAIIRHQYNHLGCTVVLK